MIYTTCVHYFPHPNSSVVVSPVTFTPYCGCCKKPLGGIVSVEAYSAAQKAIDAYDRAMGIIKQ